MKYLIVVEDSGLEVAVLFSELLKHEQVAEGFEVVSAGFCDAAGHAYGGSVSLGIKAREAGLVDSEIIFRTMEFKI